MKSELAKLLSTASIACHAAALGATDLSATWIQLVPAGAFSSRDGRGPFVSGDRAAMEEIVRRSRSYHGSNDIVVDYDHQSIFGAKDGVGGTAKAAGWIKELQARDGGIYGRVEWTEAASAAIKAGEYRYLSPVIPHRKSDGRIVIILNAALTNTPALDLAQVAASALFSSDLSEEGPEMDKILAALGLAKGSGEDAVLSAINALLTSSTAVAKAAGMKEGAKPADVLSAVTAVFADRTKIAAAVNLKADAKTDDIVAAAASAMSAGNPDPTKFVPIAAVSALQADLKTLKADLVGDKAETAVLSAIKDGKLTPALKDWGLDLYKADPAQFEKFVGNAPVLTAPQLKQAKRDPNAAPELDDAQTAVIAALGVDSAAFAKTLAAEEAKKEIR